MLTVWVKNPNRKFMTATFIIALYKVLRTFCRAFHEPPSIPDIVDTTFIRTIYPFL